ncbi:MAG: 16S rRNA processing protein RimM [Muribaculaceae bacterium]|nr:16S rRNA processing protein RimM [Muribaculaceae bacterium]
MITNDQLITVGKFHKTHGLKGELNAILDIDPAYFVEGNPLIVEIEGLNVPFYLNSIRNKGSISYLIRLEGVETDKEASEFVNHEIKMIAEDSEEWLEPNEDDLIGFTIVDMENQKPIGELYDIDDSTENVLFIVKNKDDSFYIPAADEFIKEIDYDKKLIMMTFPDGLLDMND